MNRTSVPVCRQNIRGLQNFAMKDLQNDSIVLRSLNLPIENNIDLNDLSNEGIYRCFKIILLQRILMVNSYF